MRNFYTLVVALLLTFTVNAQYASKSDAVRGIKSKPTSYIQKAVKEKNVTIFSEDFESGGLGSWTTIDNDGDGHNWDISTSGKPHGGTGLATSASWIKDIGAVTPDNWLISPAIDLSSETGTIMVEYWVSAQDQTWPSEKYKLVVSKTGTAAADFIEVLYEEVVTAGEEANNFYHYRLANLSAYVGETIYLAWVHYDCTDMFMINLDDVVVFENTTVDAAITAVTAPSNESTCTLTDSEAVTVTILNKGGVTLSNFEVSYTLGDGTPVVETVTESIVGGASYDYTFTQTLDLSTLGYYEITAEIPALENEDNTDDNTLIYEVRSTDGKITVTVASDNAGGQSWKIYSSEDDVTGSHGSYQWNITETTNVCVLDNDCYRLEWLAEEESQNTVTVLYNDVQVDNFANESAHSTYGMGSECPQFDLAIDKVIIPESVETATDIEVKAVVLNKGTETVTSLDLTYKIDEGEESAVYSLSGLSIASGSELEVKHNVPVQFAVDGIYKVTVKVANINGNVDENLGDNVADANVMVYSESVKRNVFLEHFTTAQCTQCPAAHDNIESWLEGKDNVIWLAHHSGFYTDDFTTPEDEELLAFYNADGSTYAPAIMLDRKYLPETGEPGPVFFPAAEVALDAIASRIAALAFVGLDIAASYNTNTKALTMTVSGEFVAPVSASDLRLGVYIMEDGLKGAQAGGSANYTHNHVFRDAVSATYGDEGVITSSNTDDTFTKEYTYTLDASWEVMNLKVVAFVASYNADDVNDREVHNATMLEVKDLFTSVDDVNTMNVSVYPNPSKGMVTISNLENANVYVYNMVGQLMKSKETVQGNLQLDLSDFDNGAYFVKVVEGNKTGMQKILINK